MKLFKRNINVLQLPFVFTIFLFCNTGFTQDIQNIKFDRLFSENIKYVKGLSQNWIYDIHQDSYGYMWFGTWEGLNKYDGYHFTIYNVENGLSDHVIHCILEDNEGQLWLGTGNGLNRYDRKTQQFTQYTSLPGDTNNLFYKRVLSLIQTRDGSIWLGTGAGLIRFNKKTEIFTPYLSTGQEYFSPRSNYILHLFEDNNRIIWISTSYGLVKFDPQMERSTRYYHIPGDSSSISNNNVRYVLQESSGNFWIGTRVGLNYYDTTTQKIKHYFHHKNDPFSISGNWIRVIYEDRSGQIWIGTENAGLNLYDRENDRFIRFQNILNDKKSLSNDRVYSIFEDNSGNIWVGTYRGVNRINKYANDFVHCLQTTDDNTSLNNNIIWSFTEDNRGNLWLATSQGVNIKDKKTELFSYLLHDPFDKNSIANNEVRTFLYTPGLNCFWFGYWGSGMDKYDLDTKTITHFTFNPNKNSISGDYINDLLLDKSGMIWICAGRGLNRLNPITGVFETFKHDPNDPNTISNDIPICLMEDSKGNIWVGTNDGLNKYIVDENKFIRYKHDPENINSLSNNTIFYIHEDKSGIIWVGTSGGGLNKLNPKTGKIKTYTTDQGLPNNVVYGILDDHEGNIWISTNLGLSKLYIISEQFVNYDVKDGIQSNEFNLGACYKSKDGKLYFGGMNGFNVFDPSDIKYNPNIPVIVISAFRKFNEIQPEEYFDGDTIRLNYDDNFFSFEISALDYNNPSKNKYRYKLENVDNDWINTDANNRLAEYKKVQPGSYTFKANGTNNDGIWSEKDILLTIIIVPPWYATWLFRIVIAVVVISTIWIILYRRFKRIRDKHKVEKKMLEIEKQKFDLEQKALRLQMNPHFIFNSLNSIQSYIVTQDTDKAVQYLGKFSHLMRLILTNSSYKYISIREEVKSIEYYLDLEKLRFENKFNFKLTVDKNIDQEFIQIPPMIVQPYIENAIIHGLLHKPTKGKLEIAFKLNKDSVICTVLDNGVGRQRSMEIDKESGIKRKSRGMLITKARLEILNRQSDDQFSVLIVDLKDARGIAKGTKVTLNIHYRED